MGKSYKGEYGNKYRKNPQFKRRKNQDKKIQKALKQFENQDIITENKY